MSISFTKSVGHFSEDDVQYIHISTDALTLPELELAFQSFLRACGYILDEMPKETIIEEDSDTFEDLIKAINKEK